MIPDPCGHYGCGTECTDDYIDDYDLVIEIKPIDEFGVILEITSIEDGIPFMEPDLDFELYEDDEEE